MALSRYLQALTVLLGPVFSGHGQEPQLVRVDGISLPYRVVTVSSPVQELLAEVFVEEGDRVEKDELLAKLLSEKDEIELRRHEKLLEKRQFDNRAAQNLSGQNLLSKDKALTAEAELALAQVEYDLAAVVLREKSIRAPLDGFIMRRLLEPGESVDRLEPLFEMVNTDKLRLQFYVEPALLDELVKGKLVPFFMTEKPLLRGESIVDFISPSADPQSGLFRVNLLVENPEQRYRAGVRVTGEFPRPAPTPGGTD